MSYNRFFLATFTRGPPSVFTFARGFCGRSLLFLMQYLVIVLPHFTLGRPSTCDGSVSTHFFPAGADGSGALSCAVRRSRHIGCLHGLPFVRVVHSFGAELDVHQRQPRAGLGFYDASELG